MMSFSETEYFSHYKRIRNLLRKADSTQTIYELIRLAAIGSSPLERAKNQPWLMMLLIKWIIVDGQFYSRGMPSPMIKDIVRAINMARNLGEYARSPNSFDHQLLFFRALSFQQFIYQFEFQSPNFTRQYVLFADLDPNHRFRKTFLREVGLTFEEFLRYSVVTIVATVQHERPLLAPSYFKNLGIEGNLEKVHAFFKALSASLDEIRQVLTANESARNSEEYFEQSPLLRAPFLAEGSSYRVFHPALVLRCLESFIYDRLREQDPAGFMNVFGKLFERYLEKVIKDLDLPYITEDDLKHAGKSEGELIDFVIGDATANVFIDAKGVPDGAQVMTSPFSRNVLSKTKDSAHKGIRQALEVSNWLKSNPSAVAKIDSSKEGFIIIVTFKELYLGNGVRYREFAALDSMDRIYEKYAHENMIPLENIYFMSVDSFEDLVVAVTGGQVCLAEVLRGARAADREGTSARFSFSQHLQQLGIPIGMRPALRERMDSEREAIERILLQ